MRCLLQQLLNTAAMLLSLLLLSESLTAQEEAAINSALQRIAVRQQQRQYVAPRGSNVLSSNEPTPRDLNDQFGEDSASVQLQGAPVHEFHGIQNGRQSADSANGVSQQHSNQRPVQSNVDNYSVISSSTRDVSGGGGGGHKPDALPPRLSTVKSQSQQQLSTKRRPATRADRHSARSLRTANDTFNSFVEDLYREPGHDQSATTAYSQVTGVQPINRNYTPTFHSTQYQIAQHQQMMKQQRMMEQSQALLDASKAKHQQMIAQAHQAHRSNGHATTQPSPPPEQQQHHKYAPKPPTMPSGDRKTVGAHRMARYDVIVQFQVACFTHKQTTCGYDMLRLICDPWLDCLDCLIMQNGCGLFTPLQMS